MARLTKGTNNAEIHNSKFKKNVEFHNSKVRVHTAKPKQNSNIIQIVHKDERAQKVLNVSIYLANRKN